MGRRAARALHLGLSAVGAVLYVVFVIPRWWVLVGDIPATLATVGRIATGFPIAAAAVPVALSLKAALPSADRTPELALRLRAWSAVLHLAAGALIVVTAVAEIWLGLQGAGPWLFGCYGAAGAIAVLAILGFALSFTAEKPPAAPKPPKPAKAAKPARKRRTRKRKDVSDEAPADSDEVESAESDAAPESGPTESGATEAGPTDADADADADAAPEAEAPAADIPAADAPAPAPETDVPAGEPEAGGLRNKRPTGKTRHRLRR